jgi:hypothetical protein
MLCLFPMLLAADAKRRLLVPSLFSALGYRLV